MNKIPLYLAAICLIGCASGPKQADYDALVSKVDSMQNMISSMRDSINKLSNPADQRLFKIKQLVERDDFAGARLSISQLRSVFPNSAEAAACSAIEEQLLKKEEAAATEAARIKA